MLRPGGRLVFANPVRVEPADPRLKLRSRRAVDMGGFDCSLEVYAKVPADRMREPTRREVAGSLKDFTPRRAQSADGPFDPHFRRFSS
jgi:hypothetical protein